MADATLPPVGATVVDGWGMTWVLEWHSLGADEPSELVWTRRVAHVPEFAEMEKGADISRIWHLEQELAALRAAMALCSGPCHNILAALAKKTTDDDACPTCGHAPTKHAGFHLTETCRCPRTEEANP